MSIIYDLFLFNINLEDETWVIRFLSLNRMDADLSQFKIHASQEFQKQPSIQKLSHSKLTEWNFEILEMD